MCRKTFKAFLTGGVLGFLAGVLFAPKEGEKTREDLKKKIEEFRKLLEEKEVDKKIEKIFGEVSKTTKEAYFTAQMAIVEGLAEFKGALSELDKEKYSALIREKIDGVRKKFNLDQEVVEKLRQRFERERRRLQRAAERYLSKKGSKSSSRKK